MAEKKIENKDLFSADLFDKTVKDANGLLKVLQKVEAELKEMAKIELGKLNKSSSKTVKGLKQQEKSVKKLNQAQQISQKLEKGKARLEQRLKAANSDKIQQNEKLKIQLQEQNRINKDLARESLRKTNAYAAESARLRRLIREYQNLAASGKTNTAQSKELLRQIQQLDAKLKQIDRTVGRNYRNVGNYTSAFRGLGGAIRNTLTAFGLTSGIFIFAQAIRGAFNTVRNFQKENAVLAGILGKTRSEIEILTTDAKRLGSITAKTATEVNQLQIAYARLGFTQEEILNLTEGTIDGSIALNAELDRTAALTGAVVRTFEDLDSADADKILDILTLSTQRSALNFEKLETAIPIVAGAANSAGIPFTRLVALLGKLSDSGIDASMSATALRNIFIESAADGLTYEQTLDKVVQSQDKLTAANDEFGKRAAVSADILSRNIEQTLELDKVLQDAGGTAERVANEQLDTLDGKIKLLTSAYEGFIFSIESGDGVISRSIRTTIESFTDLLNAVTLLNTTTDEFKKQSQKDETNFVKQIIGSTDDIDQVFIRLNSELNRTRERLKKTVDQREGMSIFDQLMPGGMADLKNLERIEGTLRKRIELLQMAIANPSQFIEAEKEITDAGVKEAKRSAKEIELIDRDFDTDLDKLKERLDLIDAARERLVTKTDQPSIVKFEELTAERKELEMIISIYEEMLEGEKELQKEIKEGLMTNDELADDYWKKRQKQIDEEMRLERERQELIRDGISAISALVDTQFEQSINRIDDQLNRLEGRAMSLREKAAQGNLSAEQSLAEEEKKRAELEQKREKARKQQQQSQAFFTVLETYQSKVAAGDPSPLTSTIRDVAVLRGISQSLGSFYEGTDDLGKENSKIDNKGGRLIVAHDNEQIWSKKDRDAVGWRNRDEIKEIVQMHDSGIMGKIMGYDTAQLKQASVNIDNRRVEQKLDKLNKSIQGIEIPQAALDIDQTRKMFTFITKKGNKRTIERSRLHD